MFYRSFCPYNAIVILTKRFGSHLDEVQVDVRGQTRAKFDAGLLKPNWCLSDSVFDGKFNGEIFIFIDGR